MGNLCFKTLCNAKWKKADAARRDKDNRKALKAQYKEYQRKVAADTDTDSAGKSNKKSDGANKRYSLSLQKGVWEQRVKTHISNAEDMKDKLPKDRERIRLSYRYKMDPVYLKYRRHLSKNLTSGAEDYKDIDDEYRMLDKLAGNNADNASKYGSSNYYE